jgi:hypothetical protein
MPQLPSNPLAQIAQQMAAQMGIPQEMPYGSAPGSVPACIAFVNAITALQHPHTQRAQHPHIQHAQQPRTGTQDPTDAQEDADFALALSLQEQEDAGMAPTLSSGLGGGVGGGAGKRGADPTWEESSRSTRGKFPQVRDQGMIDITDRYALLIGNSNYQGTLRDGVSRCTKDAEDMARQLACDTLGVCKFKTRVLFNKTKEEIENSIRDWSRSLPRRCVALVMFAGHALEAQAKNYLVPVDAPESMSEAEIQYKCISLDYIMACILQQLGRESLIIALLDCCREETVTRGLRTLGGTGKRGLGPVNLSDPDSAAVFVGYAAAPGMVAMERPQRWQLICLHFLSTLFILTCVFLVCLFVCACVQVCIRATNTNKMTHWDNRRNGNFTEALLFALKHHEISRQDIRIFFGAVVDNVLTNEPRRQRPHSENNMTKGFAFRPSWNLDIFGL